MRIIIFIVFIMMIIIFINELKNISASFFQINYIKDVADINIKKHCNDIYCEAETGRFNIAKNSYKLLLPNDFYNTKTYYFMILLIIIIFYINTFYNFIKYNNLYLPHNNKNILTGDENIKDSVIIKIIGYMPYILALSILILIIVILAARYAPTETQGYRNYFNINNDDVEKNNSLNIQNIHNSIISIILILSFIYGFFYCITNIKISGDDQQKGLIKATANNHKNMCMGYLIITILMTYLLFNIMNILLSFTDNKYPKLDNNRDIITKNYSSVKNQYKDLTNEKLLQRCYTDKLTSTIGPYSHDIKYDNKYGITVGESTDKKPENIKVVFYDNISNKENGDNEEDYGIDKLKVNYYFKYISPLYPYNKIAKTTYKYNVNYNTNYNFYKEDIHKLSDNNTPIMDVYKGDSVDFDAYYMIKKIRIGHLTKQSDIDKILELLINKTTQSITDENTFNENCNILLDILIFFSVNEIIYLETKEKETKDKETKDFEYIQHILLLDLIDYFKKKRGDTKNIANKDALKVELTEEIKNYSNFTINSNKKITQFFGKDYDILSNSTEIKENFSVDISYGSANKFYEKYFNISNNDNNANDEEYKLGGYIIKNIKTLIYFIIVIIVIAIVLIIFIYIKSAVKKDGVSSYTYSYSGAKTFAYDVLIPLIILIIFVIYIFIFMSFNTNYNLNVIYGLFDSSYKRDLNDMNNLIIPFIKLHTNNNKKYDKNYYDLYIITNVMASFLYSENNDDIKYKNIDITKIEYSKEETIDYNEFKKYYEEQFTIINKEFEENFAEINDETNLKNLKNLKKLYNNINSHIKTDKVPAVVPPVVPPVDYYTIADIVSKTFDHKKFTEKFKYDNNVTPPADNSKISNKIVNIILICLELFGKNKGNYKDTKYNSFINNFYFEKDKSGNIISHKFRFKKSVFGYTYNTPNAPTTINISGTGLENLLLIPINIENFEDKKKKIIEIINNYMNIISLFQYNYILSDALSTQSPHVKNPDIETIIIQDAKDVGYNKGENYLHKYKNRKLISLISNTKSFEKMSFVLVEATFKYSKYSKYTVKEITDLTPANAKTFTVAHITALTPEAKNALNEVIKSNALVNNELSADVKTELARPDTDASTSKNNAVEYVYTYIINNYNINVSNISDNYLENVVKTICYQVDNRDVVMNQESVGGVNKKIININKISEAHDKHVSILHKANQCVTYDFATNYMVNLIILGIIYYIGLDNNKIF